MGSLDPIIFPMSSETIAGVSGATLGYIHGNLPGAVAGYHAGKRLYNLSQKRMAPLKRKYEGSSGGRVVRPRRGSAAPRYRRRRPIGPRRRSGAGRRRNVKRVPRALSKKIKGVIKRTLECDFNKGTMEKSLATMYTPVSTGGQDVRVSGGLNDGTATFADRFLAFSPVKLLDAASVLYNNKALVRDASGTIDNFDFRNFKVNVYYMSFEMTIKNITNNTVHLELVELNTKKNTDKDCYQTWLEGITLVDWVGSTSPTPTRYGMRPQMLEYMKSRYIMKSTNYVIKPGESIKKFMTKKGCYDFNRMTNADGTAVASFGKGLTTEFMLINKGENKLAVPAALNESKVGPYFGSNDKRHAVVVNMKEVYKIQQPDETLDTHEGNVRAIETFYDLKLESDSIYDTIYCPGNVTNLNGAA